MESLLDNPYFQERETLYNSALEMGIPIVDIETCAIICAMLAVWGNHEMFTHNHRLVAELRYAQKRFHVEGGEVPDGEFKKKLEGYVKQLELMQKCESRVPDYIDTLFQNRYGFHFNKD